MTGLRAIMVCVDYADLLAVTLPYNRHHFEQVHIITSHSDWKTQDLVARTANEREDGSIQLWTTDLFYADGARFNKWRALEWGLDRMGRDGWIANMDADVLWPRDVEVRVEYETVKFWRPNEPTLYLDRGQLMTPLRRMAPWPMPTSTGHVVELPDEFAWGRYPIHRNVGEWAGYTQVFHASDPVLGPPPWHETDWVHAGGADSLFQRKWPNERKRRPQWQVLHLGPAGENWFGRASAYANGEVPADAAEKGAMVRELWKVRAERRRLGMTEAETFRPEKLG